MLGWHNRYAGTEDTLADIPAETIVPGIVPVLRQQFRGCRSDIEVIKLRDPAPLTDMIRPACLPDYGSEQPNQYNFFCFATGRGSAPDKSFVGQLQVESVNRRSLSGAIKTQSFDKMGAVCLGDSGSNLNCRHKNDSRWYVYGPACGITGCEGKDFAYFASAISWKPWLDKTIFDLLYGVNVLGGK